MRWAFVLQYEMWVTLLLSVVVHFTSRNSVSAHPTANAMKRSEFLKKLLVDYDRRLPPNIDTDEPTIVDCSIFVVSFDSVNEMNMDYSMTVYMRQSWMDPRLDFQHLVNDSMIAVDSTMIEKLWVPDLYFPNGKGGNIHTITVPNKLIRLYEDGRVLYSVRLSLTVSCPMDLMKFPLDTQMCNLQMESFSFTTDRMRFEWNALAPVELNEYMQLPQFQLDHTETMNCWKSYSTGNFTCLEIRFFLRREIGYYLIQTYVPSMLIVMLSWVSFWINVEAVPARISLGIITILSMITQSSGIRASLPRVSYVKAIDVWMSTCLAFVFLAMLEYAIVNVYSRHEIKKRVTIKRRMKPEKSTFSESVALHSSNGGGGAENKKIREELYLRDPTGKKTARTIDKISRHMFPILFTLFNISYWLIYNLMNDRWNLGNDHSHAKGSNTVMGTDDILTPRGHH
ncbi:glycine receptor subunit alpha-2-like [Tubulanus polymorphus]|uniref:glycine receptor subunit alpha-2-like n=1 Tax=Tubulanus polymorphus TaxID=672921 RepID=UPI003DA68BFD